MKLIPILAETSEPPIKGWWDRLGDSMREALGPSIRAMHQPVDDWLGGMSLDVAMACVVGLFAIAGIWVWTLRREFIFRGAPDQKWWRDLRIWATIILLPYIGVYLLLGR